MPIEMIDTARLHPHPQNPRVDKAKEKAVVEQLAGLIKEQGFREGNPLIVRPWPLAGDYEIVSGHRRAKAAERVGLSAVPCSVEEMDDDTAHMMLVTQNTDSAPHPIEEGLHQIASGLSQREYAERIKISRNTLKPKVEAAQVYEAIKAKVSIGDIGDRWRALAALRPASSWLWPAWTARLLKDGWTRDDTTRIVQKAGRAPEPPDWADAWRVAHGLASGAETPDGVRAMSRLLSGIKGDLREQLVEALKRSKPTTRADAQRVIEAQTPISPAADVDEASAPGTAPSEARQVRIHRPDGSSELVGINYHEPDEPAVVQIRAYVSPPATGTPPSADASTTHTEPPAGHGEPGWSLPDNATGYVREVAAFRGVLGKHDEADGTPAAGGDLRQRLRAQDRFRQTLKVLLEPLPPFDDLSEEARTEMCNEIDSLIERLTAAKQMLKPGDAE